MIMKIGKAMLCRERLRGCRDGGSFYPYAMYPPPPPLRHSVLKGEEPVGQDTASNAMNRLNLSAQANTGHYPVQAPSASSTTNQATTPTNPSGTLGRRTGVVRKASGDYSSNPKSADSSFSSTNTRSPLTSSFYTEDPSLYAELKLREERHQLDINYLHPADTSTGSAAANRPASPVRGVASNRHVKGVFTEHENAPDEVSFRRASYSFDVLPVDNLNGALLVGGGDLQKPASAATPASLLAPGAGSVDGVKQYVGAANNYAPPFKHSALGLGGDGRDYADYTVDTTMLTLTLNDPTHVAEAVTLLHNSSNLYDQIDVLHYLLSCHGGDFYVQGLGIVTDLLEEVYVKAMQLKQWSIVRQAAGLLKKMVNSLSINVTDLLIRQKPVTVGFGKLEFFISSPKNPAKLAEIIYQHW